MIGCTALGGASTRPVQGDLRRVASSGGGRVPLGRHTHIEDMLEAMGCADRAQPERERA